MSEEKTPLLTPNQAPVELGLPGPSVSRLKVRGKFLNRGLEKLYVRGVTYGPCPIGGEGVRYPHLKMLRRDLRLMSTTGFNALRVHALPPPWFLDEAQRYDLGVMVDLPWSQSSAFLESRRRWGSTRRAVAAAIRACAGHRALWCVSVGNAIPSSVLKWFGLRAVENALSELCRLVKDSDPDVLTTYVNGAGHEHLAVPGADVLSIKAYDPTPAALEAHLAYAHRLAGQRPVLVAEMGASDVRSGMDEQARTLDWQVRTALAGGVAGLFVATWTEPWASQTQESPSGTARGDGYSVVGTAWSPKPATRLLREVFNQMPVPMLTTWPRVTVVICTHNGAATIARCLAAVSRLDYPDLEVIVVDDGSTDATPTILASQAARVIRIEHSGISAARNVGLSAASGQVVAYLDDDAYPDPHWLRYLAATFMRTGCVGAGGPNLPPDAASLVAHCVAQAPGSPRHALLSHRDADHLAGCNMAFRKSALEAVGGFDPQFHAAGDDVDICWRLQERDGTLLYCPSALVWHERRSSVRAYLRQQRSYGAAEAMLRHKWPQKYAGWRQALRGSSLYGVDREDQTVLTCAPPYQGPTFEQWFGSLRPWRFLATVPLMPEWYLLVVALLLAVAPAVLWKPLWVALPLLVMALGVPLLYGLYRGATVKLIGVHDAWWVRLGGRGLVALLYIVQPIVRLWGQVSSNPSPQQPQPSSWRWALPRPRQDRLDDTRVLPLADRLGVLSAAIAKAGGRVAQGSPRDRWDLEIRGGMFGRLKVQMLCEPEEGERGGQRVRLRSWPEVSLVAVVWVLVFSCLCGLALLSGSYAAAMVLGLVAGSLGVRIVSDCGQATGVYLDAIHPPRLG